MSKKFMITRGSRSASTLTPGPPRRGINIRAVESHSSINTVRGRVNALPWVHPPSQPFGGAARIGSHPTLDTAPDLLTSSWCIDNGQLNIYSQSLPDPL